jgi:hypothetical protein
MENLRSEISKKQENCFSGIAKGKGENRNILVRMDCLALKYHSEICFEC